jgi:hypothetical protein
MNDRTQRVAKAATQIADRLIQHGEGYSDAEWTQITGDYRKASHDAWEFLQVLKESQADQDDIDRALEDFYEAQAEFENLDDNPETRRSYLIGVILRDLNGPSVMVSLEDLR